MNYIKQKKNTPQRIINPKTGRKIQVGGAVYNRLMKVNTQARLDQDQEIQRLANSRREVFNWTRQHFPDFLLRQNQDEVMLNMYLLDPLKRTYMFPLEHAGPHGTLQLPGKPNRAMFQNLHL
jgi:hypothetical protein